MKTVIELTPDLRVKGVAAVLSVLSDTFVWVPQYKPIFDVFDEVNPDVFICSTSQLMNSDVTKALQEYPNTQLVVIGMGYPPSLKPSLLCVDNNIPKVALEYLKTPYITFESAANYIQYRNGTYNELMESDVLYISETQLNSQIIDILTKIVVPNEFSVKMCGSYPLPFAEYLGLTNIQDVSNLLASAKIVIDINEAIIHDAAMNKTFCLSNRETEYCPQFSIENIRHFLKENKHRQSYIKKAYKNVQSKTYFETMKNIYQKIDGGERMVKAIYKIEGQF